MQNEKLVGFRKRGYTPRLSVIALLLAIFGILLTIFLANTGKEKETYTERSFQVVNGTVHEWELKRERFYSVRNKEDVCPCAGVTLEVQQIMNQAYESANTPVTLVVKSAEVVSVESAEEIKHFSESTYIKGAIMLHGEAGGVPSLTEQSGTLWVACNRVDSDDPFFPDDLESVIEQKWQFDGYTPGGAYTQAEYNLAVDVFERWYREKAGESAESVGRTLPVEYLFFTGDGVHNYFRKTQNGSVYVWGSELRSPYET